MNNIITPEYIKKYVQKKSGIKDLSIKNRKRNIVDARSVAFKLSKDLCSCVSFDVIGKEYNKSHASVMHGIKIFDNLKNHQSFRRNRNLYEICLKYFLKISDETEYIELREKQSIVDLQKEYENKIESLVKNYEKVIETQNKTLNLLNNNSMIKKITELNEIDYKNLEVRINAFFTMNAKNN